MFPKRKEKIEEIKFREQNIKAKGKKRGGKKGKGKFFLYIQSENYLLKYN